VGKTLSHCLCVAQGLSVGEATGLGSASPLPCLLCVPGLGHRFMGDPFEPSSQALAAASQVLPEALHFCFACSVWRNRGSRSSAELA